MNYKGKKGVDISSVNGDVDIQTQTLNKTSNIIAESQKKA